VATNTRVDRWNGAQVDAVVERLRRLREGPALRKVLRAWRRAHRAVPLHEVLASGADLHATERGVLAAWHLRRALARVGDRPVDLRSCWRWAAAVAHGAPETVVDDLARQYVADHLLVEVRLHAADLVTGARLAEFRVPATWSTAEIMTYIRRVRGAPVPNVLEEAFGLTPPRRDGKRHRVEPDLLRAHVLAVLEEIGPAGIRAAGPVSKLVRPGLERRGVRYAERSLRRFIAEDRAVAGFLRRVRGQVSRPR
jgi:hypothetical protein